MKINCLEQLVWPDQEKHPIGDLRKGFVVQIYAKKCSILVDRLWTDKRHSSPEAGFFELKYAPGNLNTCSSNPQAVIERCLGVEGIELFYFDSLAEFAQAVLDNGWEINK